MPVRAVHPDWIEIHKGSMGSVDLAGWYLADDPDNLTTQPLPAIWLAAGLLVANAAVVVVRLILALRDMPLRGLLYSPSPCPWRCRDPGAFGPQQ